MDRNEMRIVSAAASDWKAEGERLCREGQPVSLENIKSAEEISFVNSVALKLGLQVLCRPGRFMLMPQAPQIVT